MMETLIINNTPILAGREPQDIYLEAPSARKSLILQRTLPFPDNEERISIFKNKEWEMNFSKRFNGDEIFIISFRFPYKASLQPRYGNLRDVINNIIIHCDFDGDYIRLFDLRNDSTTRPDYLVII